MIVIYPPKHYLHNSSFELFDGEKVSTAESPERLESILLALKKNNFNINSFTREVPLNLLRQIHGFEYLKYFEQLSANLGNKVKYPSVFARINRPELTNSENNLGFYSIDTYTPVSRFTFKASFNSASVAYEGAFRLEKREDKVIYALCRPPGHHAEEQRMGGYCYINNAGIAAQYFSRFGKVAILDLDFHHGNGTQEIFYNRNDVFYASIHADPTQKYPYFSGYIDEIGEGEGKGFNINRPLSLGATNNQYQKALEEIILKLEQFIPDYLVISFGADTYEKDPIGGFKLSLAYYKKMAKTISEKIDKPTLVIQEGGYCVEDLGKIAVNFLKGMEKVE